MGGFWAGLAFCFCSGVQVMALKAKPAQKPHKKKQKAKPAQKPAQNSGPTLTGSTKFLKITKIADLAISRRNGPWGSPKLIKLTKIGNSAISQIFKVSKKRFGKPKSLQITKIGDSVISQIESLKAKQMYIRTNNFYLSWA